MSPEAQLLEILSAAALADIAPGDGCAVFMPDGEQLAIFATDDGIAVRRHATDDEIAAFLASDAPILALDISTALADAARAAASTSPTERARHRAGLTQARVEAASFLLRNGTPADRRLAARFAFGTPRRTR